MPTSIITLFSSVFDMVTMMIYFDRILKKRKQQIPLAVFWGCFVLMQIALYINMVLFTGNYSFTKVIITTSLSTITTFLLTFLYQSNLRHRIFVTLTFQVFAFFGEIGCALLFSIFNPAIFDSTGIVEETAITSSSKIIVFLFVCISIIIFHRKEKDYTVKYNLLLLLTPIISIFTIICIPYQAVLGEPYAKMLLFPITGLLLLNVINYYLMDNILDGYKLNETIKKIENQLVYQSEKYEQLSSAYRSTRSIVHDTKKHLFFFQSCVENEEYDKITDSIKNLITDLESKYIKINTGNLVIDAFVGNHMTMAEEAGIEFNTSIKVFLDDIPVEDYDLCIILGNLLDNSLQACKKLSPDKRRFITVQIGTSEKFFVVHVVNPLVPKELFKDAKSELFHGYGIENVKKITEKYEGTFTCLTDEDYDISVIIPISRDSNGVRIGAMKPYGNNYIRVP